MGRRRDSRTFVTSRQSGWFLALILLLALALRSAAQEPAVIGQWPGYPQDGITGMSGSENHLYMVSGGVVLSVSLSDPANPQLVSTFASPFPSWIEDTLIMVGDYVMVSGNESGVLDARHPDQLVPVPNTPIVGSPLVSTNELLFTTTGSALKVYDIHEPNNPSPIGEVQIQPGTDEHGHWRSGALYHLAVSSAYLYAAWGDRGLLVFDIQDPSHPIQIGANETFPLGDVAVLGECAVAVTTSGEVVVFDIKDPRTPIFIPAQNQPLAGRLVQTDGRRLFLTKAGGVTVFDLTEAGQPRVLGSYSTSRDDSYYSFAVLGERLALYNESRGTVEIVDIQNLDRPTKLGELFVLGHPRFLSVSGDYAFTACGYSGMQVLDLSNPSHPKPLSMTPWSNTNSVEQVTVIGRYAYVSGFGNGFMSLDVSNPAAPVIVAKESSGGSSPMSVLGNYAYQSIWHGLGIWDISNPQKPSHVCDNILMSGTNYLGQFTFALAGHYAFTLAQDYSLAVLDISNPTNWLSVARTERIQKLSTGRDRARLASRAIHSVDSSAIVVSGTHVFVLCDSVYVFDVSDPLHPFQVGTYDPGVGLGGIAASGTSLFLTEQSDSPKLLILDASDATDIRLITSVSTPGNPEHIVISGNRAIVTDSRVGLVIVDCSSILSQVPTMLPPRLQEGAVQLRFEGETGVNHSVLRATNLAGPWTILGQSIPVHGIGSLADPTSTQTSMFYRVVRE